MITKRQARDLVDKFNKVLFVGDPFQLPPVKSEDWLSSQTPNATLTEIHRQALDSPILRLATKIRQLQPFGSADSSKPDLLFVPKGGIDWKKIAGSSLGQVICATNASRSMIIKAMRPAKYGPGLHVGERVINKRNATLDDDELNPGYYIPNGAQGCTVTVSGDEVTIQWDDGCTTTTPYYPQYIQAHYKPGTIIPDYDPDSSSTLALDLAYCITVHAAQGSQWDSVLLYDDSNYLRDPIERARWRYTGATRAARQLMYAI